MAATPENTTVEKINQKAYRVEKGKKPAFVTKLISEGDWKQVLIFTRTKHGANRLSEKLHKSGISVSAIHGNKSQGARTNALRGFKNGTVRVLVATDIAARGLDIPLLPHVINFELPNVAEDYVHRIGRTGRAGARGEAISLVSQDEMEYLRGIEKLLRQTLPAEVLPGYEPNTESESRRQEPIKAQFRPNRGTNANSNANKSRRPRRYYSNSGSSKKS